MLETLTARACAVYNRSDVQLSLQHRQVGYVTVVTCRGRLVSGAEADTLLQRIEELLPVNSRILLHLGEVDYIDSGGLGLLVRCLTRVQNAAGQLSLCALSPKVSDALRVTRLDSVLKPYYAEAEALASAHADARPEDARGPLILCADTSADVLAYLRGLLKGAGYRVVTAENLHDGLILLKTMRPQVVIMGSPLQATRGTSSADEFHRRLTESSVVLLPSGFSSQDAEDAGRTLLQDIEQRSR